MIYRWAGKTASISPRDQAWYYAADITNIVWWRCEGGPLLTDDDELVFNLVLPFLLKTKTPGLGPDKIVTPIEWARRYTPRVLLNGDEWLAEADRQAREEIERQAKEDPKVILDEISYTLVVTQYERDRLKLYSLVDYRRTKEVRQQERKEKDRLRKLEDNRKQGRDTREEQRAKQKAVRDAKAALAVSMGISVRQLDRKIAKGLVDVSDVSTTHIYREVVDITQTSQPVVVVDVPAPPSNDNTAPDFSDIKNIRRGKSSIKFYKMQFPAIAYDLHVLHAHLREMDPEAGKIDNSNRRTQRRRTAWVLAELERRNIAAGGRKPLSTPATMKVIPLHKVRMKLAA